MTYHILNLASRRCYKVISLGNIINFDKKVHHWEDGTTTYTWVITISIKKWRAFFIIFRGF